MGVIEGAKPLSLEVWEQDGPGDSNDRIGSATLSVQDGKLKVEGPDVSNLKKLGAVTYSFELKRSDYHAHYRIYVKVYPDD